MIPRELRSSKQSNKHHRTKNENKIQRRREVGASGERKEEDDGKGN